jgi:hypothetical protein
LLASPDNKNIQDTLQELHNAIEEKSKQFAKKSQRIKELNSEIDKLITYGFRKRD